MNRDKRKVYPIVGVLALLLLLGVAYAATTGTLNFIGTAGFNTNVRLNIVDQVITSPVAGESVSVNTAGDTLTFAVHLSTPGETRYVKFKIENVGNSDAILGTLSKTDPAVTTGITVRWPSMDSTVVAASAKTGEYTIAVHWNPSYPSVTQDVTLSAGINYQQHTP